MLLNSMTSSRREFKSRDNVTLSYCVWEQDGVEEHRAVVLLLHGIGYHAEPYASLARAVRVPGLLFAGLDFRGHGLSGGNRKELPSLSVMLDDINDWVTHIRSIYPNTRLYLMAESMAGPYATLWAAENPNLLDGLILVAPALIPSRQQILHSRTLKDIGSALWKRSSAGILVTGSRMGVRIIDGVEVISLRANDPLAIQTVEPRYIMRLAYTMTKLLMKTKVQINAPVFILHGDKDDILSPHGSRWLFRKISSPQKVLRMLQGAGHTLVWDSSREQTYGLIENWLSTRLDTQQTHLVASNPDNRTIMENTRV